MEISLNLPTYNKAYLNFFDSIIMQMVNLDPLLNKFCNSTTVHEGPIRNIRGEKPLDQSMQTIKSEFQLNFYDIKNTNLDMFSEMIYKIANSNIGQLKTQIFKSIGEVSEQVGTLTNAHDQKFTFDIFLDALEKIKIDFDENGNHNLLMVMSPELYETIKNIKPTPEQKKRESKIMERKKEEFYASNRTRKLS